MMLAQNKGVATISGVQFSSFCRYVENKRQQRESKAEVKAPLLSIFKRDLLFNTLTACFCSGPTSSSLQAIACGASFRTYWDAGQA